MHARRSPARGIVLLEPAAQFGHFGLDERLELEDCAARERRVEGSAARRVLWTPGLMTPKTDLERPKSW